MKILYYDCFSGISGDMNLGALIDLGVPKEYLIDELSKLNLNSEFNIIIEKCVKQGISGSKVTIIDLNNIKHTDTHHCSNCGHAHEHNHIQDNKEEHSHIHINENNHDHHHEDNLNHPHHHGRNFKDIKDIILSSTLKKSIKEIAFKIFNEVATAESKVHNKPIDEVHFHEVGAIDSIVDIIGAAICIDYLNVDLVVSSPIEVGYGTLKCAHGILPVPAPATLEILKGVPMISKNVPFEATTPTGAAILKSLASEFTFQKNFTVDSVGYGIGDKTNESSPNVLRVMLCNNFKNSFNEYVVECNIDDMRSEEFELLMERLFEKGAFDVFYTPIFMKKERPACKLSVICNEEILKDIKETIFLNSSTIGIRQYEVYRDKLHRKDKIISCKFGEVPIKISFYENEEINVKPEYSKCKELAKLYNIPLNKVYNEVLFSYMNLNSEEI